MASLPESPEEVYQLYNEIDHIVQFAAQSWDQRTGGAGTRNPTIQPKNIHVLCGMERPLVCCPTGGGGGSSRATAIGGGGGRSAFTGRRGSGIDEFIIPEYVIQESTVLHKLYMASHNRKSIGPIRRCSKLFSGVIALIKLRFLLRLHEALLSFAGHRCSLHRLLVGTLGNACAAHRIPHNTLQTFELLMETMHTRFQQAWPLLIAYIATFEMPEHHRHSRASHNGTHNDSTGAPIASEQKGNNSQVVDDLFIAWLVQQDPVAVPTEAMMQELDFFNLARPVVRTSLEGLRAWQAAKNVHSTQHKNTRPAQREAHRIVLLLELPPDLHQQSVSLEELHDMAKDIVAHPKTFNSGIRARVTAAIAATVPSPPIDFDSILSEARREPTRRTVMRKSAAEVEDQLSIAEGYFSRFRAHSADPRDCGRLPPCALEAMRDSSPPWLVGRTTRFQDEPAPRPNIDSDWLPSLRGFGRPATAPVGNVTSMSIPWR